MAIAKAAVRNPNLQEDIIKVSAQEVRKEMQAVASVGHDSILCMKNKESLERFSWDRVWCEVQNTLPFTSKISQSVYLLLEKRIALFHHYIMFKHLAEASQPTYKFGSMYSIPPIKSWSCQ